MIGLSSRRQTNKSNETDIKTKLFKIQESDSCSIVTENDESVNNNQNRKINQDETIREEEVSESDIE